jgi:hypothetical protein
VSKLKLNVGQAFAERKQTVDLVASSAERIARAALALRKGRLGDAVKALGISYDSRFLQRDAWFHKRYRRDPAKAVPRMWLELQYGWKPLLQDVYGAAELLADKIDTGLTQTRAVSTAKSERTVDVLAQDFLTGSSFLTVGKARGVHRSKYVIRYGLDSECRSALRETGISNPALLAWEVLPWSFVADWFIPVGNYLEQLNAFDGFSLVDGSLTTTLKVDLSCDFASRALYEGRPGTVIQRSVSSSAQYGEMQRRKLLSFPPAALPSFKNPLTVTHALNAIALVTTAFKVK